MHTVHVNSLTKMEHVLHKLIQLNEFFLFKGNVHQLMIIFIL